MERQAQVEERRQRKERARVVYERRRQEHAQHVAEAAEERRRRWAEQQLRAQRLAEVQRSMEPDLDAERRARRARLEWQRQCLQRIALRRAIRARVDACDVGTMRPEVGSRRANMLVRRARYLYGRTDMIHWLQSHGQLAP